MLFAGLRLVRMVKTVVFKLLLIAIADKIDRHTDGNSSLEFRALSYKKTQKSVFLTHTELLNN